MKSSVRLSTVDYSYTLFMLQEVLKLITHVLIDLAREIFNKFTHFSREDDAKHGNYNDKVFLYATKVLH